MTKKPNNQMERLPPAEAPTSGVGPFRLEDIASMPTERLIQLVATMELERRLKAGGIDFAIQNVGATSTAAAPTPPIALPAAGTPDIAAPKPIRTRKKRMKEIDYEGKRRECPHCGKTKRVIEDFGLRNVRGFKRPQPWCRACRNSKDSHPSRDS